jgi:basic membrane lipoprotein Med (substrate-binding protein (PBP1-ABC) superfamily)
MLRSLAEKKFDLIIAIGFSQGEAIKILLKKVAGFLRRRS